MAVKEVGPSVRLVSLTPLLTLKIRVELKAGWGNLMGLLLPFAWRINGMSGARYR